MAHDSVANPGSGGDTFVTVDLSLNTYPSGTGKVPATVLYASADTTHAPTVFTTGQKTMANSLGVVIASDQSGIPVTGTFWQATQPISGTVTANAGTNLNTSALALDTSVNGVIVAQGSTTSGEKGPLIQGAVTTAAPSYTTAQTSPLSLTTAGALRVDGSAVTQPVSIAATVTVSGTVTANAGTNLNTSALALDTSVNGLLVAQASTTSGEKGPLIQGAVTTAAPSYTTAQTSPLSLTTAGALRGDISTIAGTAPTTVGKLDVKGADGDVFVRQATAANLNATVVGTGTFAVQAAPAASTTGGATPFRYIIAAGANQDSQNVKGSAGTVYSIDAFLNVATLRYLKLYDKATAPTSADTPVHTFLIPGNTAGAGFTKSIPVGMLFANGIGFRVTTGIADNDTGSATANDGVVNLDYK